MRSSALSSAHKSAAGRASVTVPKGTGRKVEKRAWVCRDGSSAWWETVSGLLVVIRVDCI
jgi:hypothetical protein